MSIETIRSVHFAGAGDTDVSVLTHYFLSKGKFVVGYGRMPSELTGHLIVGDAQIHYEENTNLIPASCKEKKTTLIVYTPTIPQKHVELVYFHEKGFEIQEHPQALDTVTRSSRRLCVVGTHDKTTTNTMAAHLFHQSYIGCTALLGDISKNYGTSLLLSQVSSYTVIEADGFDRLLHRLSPYMSVTMATNPDHLDIYDTREAHLESFRHYTTLIQSGGALIIRKGLALQPDVQPGVRIYTYSRDEDDFHTENIRIGNDEIFIDSVAPDIRINDIRLGVPIDVSTENGVAAMVLAHLNGVTDEEVKQGVVSLHEADRRFGFKIKTSRLVFLSDYAHHPVEITQSMKSIRELYQDKEIAAIFQSHLYTRARDLYKDPVDSLSLLDEAILTEIYPTREQPIPGVGSWLIYDDLRPGIEKCIRPKEDILSLLSKKSVEILIVLGAGDLGNYVPSIIQLLEQQSKQ